MGLGSGAVDASIQPMLAQSYDNLLERKKLKKKNLSSQQGLNSFNKSDDETVECDVKLNILSNNENSDVICIENSSDEKIKISEESETIRGEESQSSLEGSKESLEEEEEEDAHNKYTRVFSLGNMAMNIAFIIGKQFNYKKTFFFLFSRNYYIFIVYRY